MKEDAPAFPITTDCAYLGLTMRDYFAAKAMQALLSVDSNVKYVESISYEIANLMMEARKK